MKPGVLPGFFLFPGGCGLVSQSVKEGAGRHYTTVDEAEPPEIVCGLL